MDFAFTDLNELQLLSKNKKLKKLNFKRIKQLLQETTRDIVAYRLY